MNYANFSEIYFAVASVATIAVFGLLLLAGFYVLGILRDVKAISKMAHREAEFIARNVAKGATLLGQEFSTEAAGFIRAIFSLLLSKTNKTKKRAQGYKIMKKSHYIGYLFLCVLLFLSLTKIFGVKNSNTAVAFEWEKPVSIYLGKQETEKDCRQVFPVNRIVPNAETFGPGALMALLLGPTEEEKQAGYFSGLNENILIQKFEIKDKTVYIDFSSELNREAAGACKASLIRTQIETTLNNLPDIDSVIISVNGQTEGILEP